MLHLVISKSGEVLCFLDHKHARKAALHVECAAVASIEESQLLIPTQTLGTPPPPPPPPREPEEPAMVDAATKRVVAPIASPGAPAAAPAADPDYAAFLAWKAKTALPTIPPGVPKIDPAALRASLGQ